MSSDRINWRLLVSDSAQSLAHDSDNSTHSPTFLVVDDHDAVMQCLISMLRASYPKATLIAAQDQKTAVAKVRQHRIDLAILDLELPEQLGETARCKTGVSLVRTAMKTEHATSILVLGESIKPLVRMKAEIYQYKAGFAAASKSKPVGDVLKLAELALSGSIYLPQDVRSRPQVNEKWVAVLRLKYQEGLSDKAIAHQLGVSARTVRSYWLCIQDVLNVHDDPDKDLRVQIEKAARQQGLID
ncbi:hypothetical protein S7335_2250 [Synechococcus sp. PCC 7335]|uniref:response regulator transcription factor n=1 Tax=Synechococcus sp. (strain ATCC 29403 / PCC 7335) TaxID=91464 RepID=UPI00017EB13C|nr:response regulator transcription factor [Synechococcus sp. PCC 7335]EDX84553.1 hypothetical protein S7335_2250 [Synechococcus sp. PCC 7335]